MNKSIVLILCILLSGCYGENSAEYGEISCEVTVEESSDMTSPNAQPEFVGTQETEAVSENEETPEFPETTAENPDCTDYEKARIVYEKMQTSGHGTCVNYACQTYEMCVEIGLPCCLVWTDEKLCGHVANTVKISDIWFILDTQGGCFLDYNYGFTEVVDIDGNHVANGDILSNYSYDELFS